MPTYEYEHSEEACELGRVFDWPQSMKDDAFKVCPRCGAAVRRLISRPMISTPKGDSDLKSMGFAKLVKRDDGVYENVTALNSESRYMLRDKPETMPDIKKRIGD